MVKFLHTSDWHLGMRRHFLSEEAEPRYRQDRLEAVRRIGEIAAEEGCDFVVAAGDLLDSNQVDPRTVARGAEALRSIPVPVYLLPGNHDAADASSMLCSEAFARLRPERVHVLDRPGVVEVAPGVEIVAAPWRTRRPLTDLVREACEGLEPGPVRIALGHGAVDRLSPDADDPAMVEVARAESVIAAGCIHYLALGDRHSVTGVGSSGRIWYAGTPEPTAFDEEAPGEVLVVTLDREEIEVRRRRVGRWAFRRLQAAFTGDDELDAFAGGAGRPPGQGADRPAAHSGGNGNAAGKGASRRHPGGGAARLRRDRHLRGRSELAVVPDDADFADLELAGFAREALDELRAGAEGEGPDAGVARDALGLLVRLAGRGA
jgi:DNA repair exonuclease SbcCD nuclease subunit